MWQQSAAPPQVWEKERWKRGWLSSRKWCGSSWRAPCTRSWRNCWTPAPARRRRYTDRLTHPRTPSPTHPRCSATIWVWLRVLVASLDKGLGTHSAYAHRGSVPLRVPPPDARRQSAVTEAFFRQTSPRLNILSVTIVCLWRPPAQLRTGRFFPFSFHSTLSSRFFFFLTKCNMKCYPLKTDRTPRCSFSELCLVTHWGRHTRGVWQRPPTHCKPPAITKGRSELLGGAPIQSLRCGSGAIISLTLVCLMA